MDTVLPSWSVRVVRTAGGRIGVYTTTRREKLGDFIDALLDDPGVSSFNVELGRELNKWHVLYERKRARD